MRIEKIILKNYRQFRQIEVKFRNRPDTDLHFIIGTNGTGKTNLLNAINWCLYGDEPHLSKDSQRLPILNLKSFEKIDIGKEREVSIEVWAEAEEGTKITFKRKSIFRKSEDGNMMHQGSKFEVMVIDERGNTNIVSDEGADTWVERFVPKNIREFFFFDGERLDNYFKEATGQNIRHAVFQVSQIDLLENNVERKLLETLKDLTKEAGRMNPKIEEARTKLEQSQNSLDEILRRVQECGNQIEIARRKVLEYEEKLRGIPNVEELENEKKQLEVAIRNTKDLLMAKKAEKENRLIEFACILNLWPAITTVSKIIEDKRRNREIPPPVDRKFLEEVLQIGSCSVCGRLLDESSSQRVNDLIKEVTLSSEAALVIIQMENPLFQYTGKVREFKEQMKNITNDIGQFEIILGGLSVRKNQIDSLMAGYDNEKVRDWYHQLQKFEELRDKNLEDLGRFQLMEENAKDILNDAQRELDIEIMKEEKARGLLKKVNFCKRALDVTRSTRDEMMKDTRERIERETRTQFFNLLWKTSTFGDVQIKPDYSISLIHSLGYECLGSVSAGERELLALSFTLALHKASGFDSPILIDTPVARISDVTRKNVAKVLCEVSTTKQTILLFTPDEHSEEISSYLDGRASGRYSLKLSKDETEAIVEVL